MTYPVCEKRLSNASAFCPHCGHELTRSPAPTQLVRRTPAEQKLIWGLIGAGFLFFIAMCSVSGPSEPSAAELAATERQTDSVTALRLTKSEASLSAPDAIKLDGLVHRHRFTLAHERAHGIAVDAHLDSAATLLKPNSDGWGKVDPARRELNAIAPPLTPKETERRASLEARADKHSKLIQASAERMAAKLMIEQRREMAKRMETGMLDQAWT